jgi:hypothetical protein
MADRLPNQPDGDKPTANAVKTDDLDCEQPHRLDFVHVNAASPPSDDDDAPAGPRSNSRAASNRDKELVELTKDFFRETGVYLIFLILFCAVVLGVRSGLNPYLQSANIRDHLLDEEFPGANHKKTFFDVGELDEFWEYYQTVFPKQVYTSEWYNGDALTGTNEQALLLFQNVIVGGIQMRQLRVSSERCSISSRIRSIVPTCYPEFSNSAEQTSNIIPANSVFSSTSPYVQWRSSSYTDDISYWARVSTYPGSGFTAILPNTNGTAAKAVISQLKAGLWLDRSTRAILTDLTMYNANLNLFTQMKLINEFPASGGVVNSDSVRTILLFPYESTRDYVLLAFELLFCLMILYYLVEEVTEFYKDPYEYIRHFWNYVDWLNLILFAATISLRVVLYFAVSNLNVTPTSTQYVSFTYVGYLAAQEMNVNAINGFIMFFKLFKYLSIFPRLALLSDTISNAVVDLLSFFFMFFIVFLGFSIAFYISMGRDAFGFSTIPRSMLTLFQAALGGFDFEEIQSANRVLGPILFVLYMLLVFYILANMFIAIISGSYEQVREEVEAKSADSPGAKIFEFLKTKLLRRGKDIVELQRIRDGLSNADANKDRKISKEELIARVGAETANVILSHYDMDANGMLDVEEIQRVQEDLRRKEHEMVEQQERDAAEIGEEVLRSVRGDRPASARAAAASAAAIATVLEQLNRMQLRMEAIASRIDSTQTHIKVLSGYIVEQAASASPSARRSVEMPPSSSGSGSAPKKP